jgi:Family of unknown function (DUF6880)
METDRRKKLTELGPEALADALLELAVRIDAADDMVERLIATPNENIRRYKAKLADLKRGRRFIPWNESAAFAHELEMLLADLKSGVDDPRTGVELMAAFYRADGAVFEECDDSNGTVGDVFLFDAKELFVSYASKCRDKQWLSGLLFDLDRDDNYGVRDILVDCAGEYLPESTVRDLIERFQSTATKEKEDYKARHWLLRIESLAGQIKDAPLFEKTRLASRDEPSAGDCVDIARVYLESGDVETALSWLQRVSEEENFQAVDRDKLLLDIYGKKGDAEVQTKVAWRIFRRYRSAKALADLLEVIGHDQRDAVIESEVADVLGDKSFSHSSAIFLAEVGRLDAAETYLLDHADQFDGNFYGGLLSLAEAMEGAGRGLCASILFRALLDSILRRAYYKAYAHGVRYLKRLDQLAMSVSDWRDFENHSTYLSNLRREHGRKRSFWSRYEK